jgi:hypothetical protein
MRVKGFMQYLPRACKCGADPPSPLRRKSSEMVRRRSDMLTALSLLVLVVITVMWVRSLFRQDVIALQAPYRWALESGGGELRLRFARVLSNRRWDIRSGGPNTLRWILNNQHHEKRQVRFLGFGYGTFREVMAPSFRTPRAPMIPRFRVDILAVPYWAIFITAGALPTRRAWNARIRQRRARDGRCPECGYDMRATGKRCPECGMHWNTPF